MTPCWPMSNEHQAEPSYPAHVRLNTQPMGVIASAMTARRNVLELIPGIAVRQPMVSGKTGKRWHMVMDPAALRRVLKENVADYPKSLVTRLMLEPAVGQSMFVAEGAHWRWQRSRPSQPRSGG